VALKLRNVDAMREEFLAVSTPSSDLYGKHLTLQAVQEKYGPLKEDKARIMAYFASIPGAKLDKDPASDMGDMFIVTAPIHAIETKLSTKLSWRQHTLSDSRTSKALRADTDINIPDDISQHLSFVSLNSPITQVIASAPQKVDRGSKDAINALTETSACKSHTFYQTNKSKQFLIFAGHTMSVYYSTGLCSRYGLSW
jgi:Pro-kumamolisin, activation domain